MGIEYRPTVKLTDANGNVKTVVARCYRAAKDAGWPKEKIKAVMEEMYAKQSYDAMLQIAMRKFEVE